jgi:mannose-6-phosphate isomerase
MNLFYSVAAKKEEVFAAVRKYLSDHGFTIIHEEYRPWGGFLVIDEEQALQFIKYFFAADYQSKVDGTNKLSPKILLVEAGKRLSWQYHHRRAEIWKIIGADTGVITGITDVQGDLKVLSAQEIITLQQGERHRLVGLTHWGIIAEIWQHTDKNNPSDENDIIRLDDDFGR